MDNRRTKSESLFAREKKDAPCAFRLRFVQSARNVLIFQARTTRAEPFDFAQDKLRLKGEVEVEPAFFIVRRDNRTLVFLLMKTDSLLTITLKRLRYRLFVFISGASSLQLRRLS